MDRIHHRRRLVAALIVMLGVGSLVGAPSPVSALSRESSAAAQVDGSCSGALPTGTVVGMAATANDRGYWIANTAGEVVACGDASNFGSLPIRTEPSDRRHRGHFRRRGILPGGDRRGRLLLR